MSIVPRVPARRQHCRRCVSAWLKLAALIMIYAKDHQLGQYVLSVLAYIASQHTAEHEDESDRTALDTTEAERQPYTVNSVLTEHDTDSPETDELTGGQYKP